MGFFEIAPRRPLLVPTPRGVRLDGSATKRGPVGPRGPQGVGADGAVQVAMSQQAGTAMRVGVEAGTVGLLVIGDSKSAGTGLTNFADRWQNRLAALMRARFPITGGDTMRGLIPANMSDPYDAMSGRPTTTGTTYPVDTAGLGYNTLQLELGSVLTFPAATWPSASTLPIGYHTHSGANGDLEVLVDGVVQTTIPCAGAGEGEPVRTSIPITAGTHTVSMRPKAGTAPVRVMYVEQRSASTGWHLYDASRPGLAARHVVAGPAGAAQGDESFAAAVADLPSVRLAVVALGANDMTISTPAQYGADVRGVVDMVKAGHPTAGVVVVLPAALTDDSAVVDDVQAYHTAARAALVDVPDLSIVAETQLIDTTGPNAGAWLADTVHPNALGHDLISRALAGSLIGLDGPSDALGLVQDAIAPAVAAAQSSQAAAQQSAADAQTALQAQFLTQDEGVAALIETSAGPNTKAAGDARWLRGTRDASNTIRALVNTNDTSAGSLQNILIAAPSPTSPHTIDGVATLRMVLGGYDSYMGPALAATMIQAMHASIDAGSTHGLIVGGSYQQLIDADYSSAIAGTDNIVGAAGKPSNYSTALGGQGNRLTGYHSAIIAGLQNTVAAPAAAALAGKLNVTYGDFSLIGGLENVIGNASQATWGQYTAIVGGYRTKLGVNASSRFSAALGGREHVIDVESAGVVGGKGAVPRFGGAQAWAMGWATAAGDAQMERAVFRGVSTDAFAKQLLVDGAIRLSIPANTTWAFEVLVTGRRASDGETGAWRVTGVISRGVAASTTALIGTPSVTALATTAGGAAAWGVDVVADATNGALSVRGRSPSGGTVNWVGGADLTEVTA